MFDCFRRSLEHRYPYDNTRTAQSYSSKTRERIARGDAKISLLLVKRSEESAPTAEVAASGTAASRGRDRRVVVYGQSRLNVATVRFSATDRKFISRSHRPI